MVAVVGEEQAAPVDEQAEAISFVVSEPNQLVSRHEQERKRQEVLAAGGDHHLFRIDRNVGVLDHRIEDVGGDLRVIVPVTRVVPKAGKDELRCAGASL